MLLKFNVILHFVTIAAAQLTYPDWELAVVSNDQIDLLLSNGSLIGSKSAQFSRLKALTFDNVRHQFVVSDMDHQNDTIYSVQLTKETEIEPIIEDLPDDIQGLAIDPISDILYWTDSINRTINYVFLNDSQYKPAILFAFTDKSPQDITIDVCHRYLYWTNSDMNGPSIERSKLDGSEHQILVNSDLHHPAGISIDYFSQKLFWADIKEGIYFSIESINLDGTEREVAHEGTHCKPFGVTVDAHSIYWSDLNNNALWQLNKHDNSSTPRILRHFTENPMGVIAKNVQIKGFPDCVNLKTAISKYNESVQEIIHRVSEPEPKEAEVVCLNGGYKNAEGLCVCGVGFAGSFCEVNLCHNYCVHGECYILGKYPKCRCLHGFMGERCEVDSCEGFCLNGGFCRRYLHSKGMAACDCPEGFTGERCQVSDDICEGFCLKRTTDVLLTNDNEIICRCLNGVSSPDLNVTSLPRLGKSEAEFVAHFQDPAFVILCTVLLLLVISMIILAVYTHALRRHRRPRIKKRIIVNKNVTPLTYRPQPAAEQCEITIEDCCNMNICETPCFEPPKLACLQTKNDDKKKLLSNMESGEDMY